MLGIPDSEVLPVALHHARVGLLPLQPTCLVSGKHGLPALHCSYGTHGGARECGPSLVDLAGSPSASLTPWQDQQQHPWTKFKRPTVLEEGPGVLCGLPIPRMYPRVSGIFIGYP